jgi:predicted AAA+ superfamily ATPase
MLKKEIKLSKDFFYNKIQEYEENGTIIFCKKFEHPRAVKKIFIYNHGFIDSITYNKKFINVFSSMIFLELYGKKDKVYYLDGADFYIPNKKCIIICMPFFNNTTLSTISNKLLRSISTLNIETITIVTVSNYDNIFIDEIPCDVLPFYEWALSD